MKPIRILWCVAAAALVVGCQDNPIDPTAQADEVTAPTFQALHESYPSEGYWNNIAFYPCLNDGEGEVVWERGQSVSEKRRVYQPSGNQNRSTKTSEWLGYPEDDPYYNGPNFTLTGLESGDIWTVLSSRSQALSRKLVKKDGFVYHQQFNFWVVNQDGEQVHMTDKYNLHCDFDWNCTQERIGGTCPVDWLDNGPPDPLP